MTMFLSVIAAVVVLTAPAIGQRSMVKPKSLQTYGDPMYADAVILPKSSSDSANVHVALRFNLASLVFSKVNSIQENRGNFFSVIAMSVEARDAVGVVRQRVRYNDTVFVNSYEHLAESGQYHYGSVELALSSGQYTITIEPMANRDQSQRKIVLPKTVIPKREQRSNIAISCAFAQAATQEFDVLRPVVFNGNMPFPAGRVAVIATVPIAAKSRSYDVWIRQQPYEEGDIHWWDGVDIHTTATNQGALLALGAGEDINVRYGDAEADAGRSLVIPINASDVVPGRYLMTLVPQGTTDTLKYAFRVEWESMPLSLRSLSYALDVLAYICPEETLDSLRDADEVQQRERLMDWWRGRDQSKETAHNEHMAEYYRRVDKASYAYATLKEPDGAFTDRGKVYILYGAPTKIDRKTSKGGDQIETWIYTNGVRTVFVFAIEDGGQYRLTTVQPLRK